MGSEMCIRDRDTVMIFPVTSVELGDISQYSFDCGDAEEYVTF